MIEHCGLWWPDDVGETWRHALRHVQSIEWSLARCKRRRIAVQAGGNIGLWPRRMSDVFAQVFTFEPDAESRACLERNVVGRSVVVSDAALGDRDGVCAIKHRGLGSHRVVDGASVRLTTIDALGLTDVDLVQLDVEGYEWHALMGARATLTRCRPLLQIELRDFTTKYGQTDAAVRTLLHGLGYRQLSAQAGNDFVFGYGAAA